MTSQHHLLAAGSSFMTAVQEILATIIQTQADAMAEAANAVVETIASGGMVYLFGTGHSHLMAEEGHFRAGGLAAVCPILSSAMMLHEGAVTSSSVERTSGVASAVLQRYQPTAQDVLFVFSNSGVNMAPVEMALAAKEKGLTVIGVVARAYADQVPVGPVGRKLTDVADIVIDNQGPPGDALIEIGQTGVRTGAVSTISGAFILNAILTEAATRLTVEGQTPPVYISSNMPGATDHNAALVEQYRRRNPHL